MKLLGAFLPDQFLPLVLIIAGICLVLGLKRLATSLFILVLAMTFLPTLIAPVLDALPWQLLLLVGVLLCLSILGEFTAIFIGRGAANTMVGSLAAGFVRALFFIPRLIVRGISGLWLTRR